MTCTFEEAFRCHLHDDSAVADVFRIIKADGQYIYQDHTLNSGRFDHLFTFIV